MSFNYPQFLWALVSLAIPIIIHLFNFRKTIRIYFSNTRFLKQIKQETTQKRKLKQYLVLASRLLFLLFFVLAFAQPFLPATEQLTSQNNVVIYLDNSYSMSAPVEEKTRALDAGISFVQEIVEVFPAETRYQLLTNDFAPFSNSFKTKTEIIDLLSQIRLSAVSRTQAEIKNRITEKGMTLFWISDFQKSTWGEPAPFDSTWQVRLVHTGQTQRSNVFIDSIYLENPFVIGGDKNALKVRLRNDGPKAYDGLITKLTINGVQAATTSIAIEPNSQAEASFDLTQNLKGLNEAQLSFTDFPVSFDNDFYFALNSKNRLNITEIKTVATSTFVEKVFGNKELFAFRAFSLSNVDYSIIDASDLVVLNGVSSFDAALSSALTNYKSKGGTLLIIPSAKPEVSSYQALSSLPVKVIADSKMTDLELPDFKNPFFENVFEERTTSMALPHASRLLDWGEDRSAILKFKDGSPFLSQFANVFLLASPLDKASTDFYNHALFLPVMYRIAASGKKTEQQLYYSLSSSVISVAADSLFGDEPLKLAGAQELIPSQTKAGNRILLELPRYSISPGFYKVTFKSDTLDLLAFNLDKNESLLASYSAEEIKNAFGSNGRVSLFEASSPGAFSSEIKERYLGTPLWKYCLMLALMFLLAEVLLIRFLK